MKILKLSSFLLTVTIALLLSRCDLFKKRTISEEEKARRDLIE